MIIGRKAETYHLQSPHASYPNFQLALHAFHVLEVDAFPPTSTGWFAPEKQKLLGHADGVVVGQFAAADVGAETRQSETANYGFLGFAGTMAPAVIVIKPSV